MGIITFPHHERGHELFDLGREISSDNYVVLQRLLGCRRAFKSSKIKLSDVLICEAPNNADGGKEAVDRIFAKNPNVTAFICFSDRLAYGAMSRCRALGMRIPQHVSVTGFNDLPPMDREAGLPRLTTVKQNAFEKGRKAAEALLHRGGTRGLRVNIDAEFVVGDSTGKCAEAPRYMSALSLHKVTKIFNGRETISDVSLDVESGEFIVLVGPSGCGKSTMLRMIAGLEKVTSGSIFIDEEDVTEKAASRRGIAMVFQSYALYPHMTVRENLSFGLKNMKFSKAVISDQVGRAAETLQLSAFLDRLPHSAVRWSASTRGDRSRDCPESENLPL